MSEYVNLSHIENLLEMEQYQTVMEENELIQNRGEWTDIMVDVETNSNDICNASIIQLSAVMFNLEKGTVGPKFNRCLKPITTGEPETLNWWVKDENRKKIFTEILNKGEDPLTVINDFIRWNRTYGAVKHFWSKPSHFDYTLLAKYFKIYRYKNPYPYWKARDMRSYLLALFFPEPLPDLKVEDKTEAHDALVDTISQVTQLLYYHQNNPRKKE